MMANNQQYTGFEIAIIGMACRYPGALNVEEYWNNLVHGIESIRTLSDAEISGHKIAGATLQDHRFVKAGIDLPRKELFDSFFFNYRPEDASLLNPAHKIFHECAWEALEDAGYDPDETAGLTGLYAGSGEDLNWKVYSVLKNIDQRVDRFTLSHLNNKDYLSSLLAYKLNLDGPSFSVNTACSTSLVAIHLACRSLLMGEARMALAGAVSVRTEKQKGYLYQEGMILSADGHCRAFDKDASGTINGEGGGVVVLKRLKNAMADGDHIYAIIKGSAINNDGNRKVGFTAPSVEGQAACIRMAHEVSKVDPAGIDYVEAHGTGTRLGDPIEMEALNIAFKNDKVKHCALGSVKTNIGHLDTAAGVAGLMKAALSLKYKQIPATLHFKAPNPEVDFAGGPFYVNSELKEWSSRDRAPRRAGVSSFGIGGTNAHIVLEEAPEQEPADVGRDYKILVLSAKTEKSLNRYLQNLKTYLDQHPETNLADMAFTLQSGRRPFEYRKSIVFRERKDLLRMMEPLATENPVKSKNNPIVFLFPGQGSQYANMAKGLYNKEDLFREEMDRGLEMLKRLTGTNFKEILFTEEEGLSRINETRYAQPLIFLVEYSLARLMLSFGLSPRYMIGHSIGEYTAACISGVFSYEDALKLLVRRGELMYELPEGIMLSIPMTPVQAQTYLGAGVSLAAVNGPEQIVLSGDTESMSKLMVRLNESDISYAKIHTSHAFHSATQDAILDKFRKELEKVNFNENQIPFLSNLTGRLIERKEACSPDYWVAHLRNTVKFSEGIAFLLSREEEMTFVEVGAGYSLLGLVRQHHSNIKPTLVNLVRHPRESGEDTKWLAEAICRLWRQGAAVNWTDYYSSEKRRRVSLPTYCFEDIKYPAEVDPFEEGMLINDSAVGSANGHELKDWVYYPVWKSSVSVCAEREERKGYLIFSPDDHFAGSLTPFLLKDGDAAIEIIPGEYYHKVSRYKYILNPAIASDYRTLVEELLNDGMSVTDIVHGWTLDVDSTKLKFSEENREVHLAFFSLANIVQALLSAKKLSNRNFILLTNRLHNVTGREELSYAPSLILGLMNVLPQEYSVTCFNLDIDRNECRKEEFEKISEEINGTHNDRIVALRNGKRWVQDYQRNSSSLPNGKKSLLQRGGLYLITGGSGNVGRVLAKYLRDKYQAKIVLIGRSRMPPTFEDPDIRYYSADVSEMAELHQAVQDIGEAEGPILGIIHAAGITDHACFELVEDISPKNALTIFAPKTRGIENIYRLFKDKQLDFVWITSSLASVLGGLSYGAYAAANLYMDHFIASKARELPNWKCIQLAEMLFNPEEIQKENNASRTALKPQEIGELFEWSLTLHGQPVLTETVTNLFSRLNRTYVQKKKNYLDNDPVTEEYEKAERPLLKSNYIPPSTETEKTIVAMLEDFFAIKDIGVEDNFFELGGDSLKAMVFLKRMEQAFHVKPSLEDFFNAGHVRQLCEDIDELLWINKPSQNQLVSTI